MFSEDIVRLSSFVSHLIMKTASEEETARFITTSDDHKEVASKNSVHRSKSSTQNRLFVVHFVFLVAYTIAFFTAFPRAQTRSPTELRM